MAELIVSRHARMAVERRGLARGDIRACVYRPDRIAPGKAASTEVRCRMMEDGRTMVAVVHRSPRHFRLITAYVEGRRDAAPA